MVYRQRDCCTRESSPSFLLSKGDEDEENGRVREKNRAAMRRSITSDCRLKNTTPTMILYSCAEFHTMCRQICIELCSNTNRSCKSYNCTNAQKHQSWLFSDLFCHFSDFFISGQENLVLRCPCKFWAFNYKLIWRTDFVYCASTVYFQLYMWLLLHVKKYWFLWLIKFTSNLFN